MTFPEFCASLGIILPRQIEPGKTMRVPTIEHERKRNGLIRLDLDEKGGIACNYERGEGVQRWFLNGERPKADAIDNAALSARIAARREKEREAIERAKKEWSEATALVGAAHPYCERKKLTMDACRNLRVSGEHLLVPMFQRRNNLCSLQRINAEGEKRFVTGAPTKGAWHEICRPRWSMTIFAEGFATGATVFSAMPMARVIVCFSADNLVAVAERGEWSGMVAIAADNDRDTEENTGRNPGVECAERAAKILGCGVAIPYPTIGTDWNDSFLERLEKATAAEATARYPSSPMAIRMNAGATIARAMMKAAKMI